MAFAYKRSLTIDHTQCGSSDSSSFPVLVKLDSSNCGTTLKTVANGGHIQNTVTQTGGNAVTMPADLIFTSDSGGTTKVPWEIESYDAVNGILWAWVQLATVSHSSNTVFYVFYDDASVSTQQNTSSFAPSAVWNANYQQVLHLADGTTLNTNDSTSNGFNTTTSGVPAPSATTGQIDGGMGLTSAGGANQYIQYTAKNIINNNTDNFTVSAWVNASNTSAGSYTIYASGNFGGGYSIILRRDGTDWNLYVFNGSSINASNAGAVVSNTWAHIVGTWDGSNIRLYVNGVLKATTPIVSRSRAGTGGSWGNDAPDSVSNFWEGKIDEARISNTARSTDWVTTEYNNQLNPESFVAAGAETALGGGLIARIVGIFQAVNRANSY